MYIQYIHLVIVLLPSPIYSFVYKNIWFDDQEREEKEGRRDKRV